MVGNERLLLVFFLLVGAIFLLFSGNGIKILKGNDSNNSAGIENSNNFDANKIGSEEDGKDLEGEDYMKKFEKVFFTAEDGFKISGNFSRGNGKAVVLLHQLNMDKRSYSSFAEKLNESGFTVLALDLRGHGESLEQNGVKRVWQDFSEPEFNRIQLDVAAAEKFLSIEGFSVYAIVGSSIGANTALNYSATNPSVRKIVLLSPGLDFKGIKTDASAGKVKAQTLIVASSEDSYSFASSKSLNASISGSEFKQLSNAGHGTNMFKTGSLEKELVEWLLK